MPTSMETAKAAHAQHVLTVARLRLSHRQVPLRLLIVHVRSTPTETAARAQLVSTVIRTVPQMFKQLPAADVPRATTLRMDRTEQADVQSVRSTRTKWLPETEMRVCAWHVILAAPVHREAL